MEKYEKVMKFIKEGNGIYFTKELKENGIDKYYINKLLNDGVVERYEQGVYLRSDVFVSRAQSLFENLGINPETVVIEIEGIDLNGNPITREITPNQSIQLKYKTPFTVRVSYNYSFSIWSNFAPGFNDCQQSITSTGLAEYKQNFDNWDGE